MDGGARGRRELFLYWRVAATDAATARQAALRLQAALRERHGGLRTALYLRDDGATGEATFMECYAMPGPTAGDGIDAGVQRDIVDRGNAALQTWLRSARHIEVFDRCDD